jgi:RsiW-degrading membrane proteinase PrsW (M82 family)
MLVGLVAVGSWALVPVLRQAFAAYPVASAVAVGLFVAYAVPFILLLRVIDYLDRPPVLLQAAALAWGGAVATSAAIAGGKALQDILAKTVSPGFAAQWGPAVAAAGLEETLKVLGVIAIVLVAPRAVTSVVDGFLFGALVGLGFQVVENIVFSISAVTLNGARDQVEPVLVTFALRGFIGGLWSHTLFTALSAAGVAYFVVRRDKPLPVRIGAAIALFGAAWSCHFLWNSPWLGDGFGAGPAGALAAILIKGIPALVVGATLLVAAERREADYYSALLAGLADPRVATTYEIKALVSPRWRFNARRQARRKLGWAGARATRRLQRAQAHLAVALSRDPSREPGPEVLQRRREVLRLRHELMALGLAGGRVNRRRAMLTASAVILAETLAVGALVAGISFAVRWLGGS